MAEILKPTLANFRRGDTKKIKIDYGDFVDITGYKFWLTFRASLGDPAIVLQVVTTAGDHILDQVANGKAWIQIESDVSGTLQPGRYVWDVQRLLPNTNPPDVFTLAPAIDDVQNRVTVFDDVTKVN